MESTNDVIRRSGRTPCSPLVERLIRRLKLDGLIPDVSMRFERLYPSRNQRCQGHMAWTLSWDVIGEIGSGDTVRQCIGAKALSRLRGFPGEIGVE